MAYELSSTPSAVVRHRLDAIAATALSLTRRNGPDAVRHGSTSTHDEDAGRRAKMLDLGHRELAHAQQTVLRRDLVSKA